MLVTLGLVKLQVLQGDSGQSGYCVCQQPLQLSSRTVYLARFVYGYNAF